MTDLAAPAVAAPREGPLLWPIFKQGSTLAAAMASHALVNLVDLWLVGKCGPGAVAGVHVATTVNFLPMIVGNGISVASMAVMARAMGAGRVDDARRVSSRAFTFMLVLGVVLGVALATLTVPCVELQGATGESRTVGIEYLLVANLGTVGMFALMQVTASMRVVGETLMPLALLLGANVLNLLLNLILIFGWEPLGIEAMGAPGSAYGTVIARAVTAFVGVWWLARAAHPLRLTRLQLRRGPPGELRRMLLLGAPQSLQMVVRAGAVIGMTALGAAVAGQTALTTLGVTTRLDTLLLFAAAGFASAGTTVVGHAIGAGQLARARRAGQIAAGLAVGFGLVLAVALWLAAEPLIAAFVHEVDGAVLAMGSCYLALGVIGQPGSCFAIAASGGVNGAGRTMPPLILDAVVYVGVLAPLVWLATRVGFDPDLRQLWGALAATHVVLAVAHAVYLRRGRWSEPAGSG